MNKVKMDMCPYHGYTEFTLQNNGSFECRKCNIKRVHEKRKEIKLKLVEYKGGRCEICGYDKCVEALDFHHLNPEEKEFNLTTSGCLNYEKLCKEADKCILVCSNCHREIHAQLNQETHKQKIEEEKENIRTFYENRSAYNVRRIKKENLKYSPIISLIQEGLTNKEICEKLHISNKTLTDFCKENNINYNKKKKVEDKPTKEELLSLIKDNSFEALGRMFGVSSNAIRKWCEKYNLPSTKKDLNEYILNF